MSSLVRILGMFFFVVVIHVTAYAQKEEDKQKKEAETESFGEFVEKVGKSIWNRFNERFNLEEAGKSLVHKGDQILSPLQKKKEIPNSGSRERDGESLNQPPKKEE